MKYAFYIDYNNKLFIAKDPADVKFKKYEVSNHDPIDMLAYIPVNTELNHNNVFELGKKELYTKIKQIEYLTNQTSVYFVTVDEELKPKDLFISKYEPLCL